MTTMNERTKLIIEALRLFAREERSRASRERSRIGTDASEALTARAEEARFLADQMTKEGTKA